jgi:glycosyltransferase involved in cell wall biosynthesis
MINAARLILIMKQAKVSILMTACNAERYIAECIQSIIAQDFLDWELIVVDDFSTDRTFHILLEFAKQDSRIHLFRNTSKGIIPAIALAFSEASGQFITRMDADDIMPSSKLTDLYKIAQFSPKTISTGQVQYFSESQVTEGYQRYQDWLNEVLAEKTFTENIYRECIVASPNWMVHRSCFDVEINLASLNYPEDYDLVFKWYQKGFKFIGTPVLTHLWREHAERTSRNSEIYQQESFFRLKTNYFIKLELKANEKIQLIGAGKKGKLVAKILKENSIPFAWFDYQKKEEINGVLSVQNLSSQFKTILTNWPVDEGLRIEVKKFIDSRGFVFGKNIWLF